MEGDSQVGSTRVVRRDEPSPSSAPPTELPTSSRARDMMSAPVAKVTPAGTALGGGDSLEEIPLTSSRSDMSLGAAAVPTVLAHSVKIAKLIKCVAILGKQVR